jgi:Arm DNA-binding domain
MARRTLTDKSIEALKPAAKRYTVPDPKLAGHYVRVMQSGAKSFVAVTRDTRGKQIWHTIGSTNLYRLEEARELARTAIKAIKAGEEREEPQSFQEAEPLPYSEFGPPIGLQHPFGYSMHFPTMGGGYSRPLRYEKGGVVQSPYLPRHKVVLTPDEVAFCKAHGISFAAFARHKLNARKEKPPRAD